MTWMKKREEGEAAVMTWIEETEGGSFSCNLDGGERWRGEATAVTWMEERDEGEATVATWMEETEGGSRS